MRRYLIIILLAIVSTASAQSSYEAVRLFGQDYGGTARFVGMGGAMGVLGADISVMGTNPAGIALYRSNDIAITAGLSTFITDTDMSGRESKTNFSIENAGVVIANYVSGSSVKYLNVGLNYSKRKNLNREFYVAGNTGGFSQMYQMQALYYGQPFDIANITRNNYRDLDNSWLALLGADGGLLYEGYENASGEIIDQGDVNYTSSTMVYRSQEEGGVDEIDLNLSCNIDDRLYLGATLGFHAVDYSRYSYYGEDDSYGSIYTLSNWYNTDGTGFELKLGAIVRPFAELPLRLGVAFSTPVYYSLTDRMSAVIEGQETDFAPGYMDTYSTDAYGDDFYVDYRLRTPASYSFGVAYTFGTYLAVDAEYEISDYTTARMEYSDGANMEFATDEFKSNMKRTDMLRVGAEYKFDKNFSMRCGYNYSTAAFEKDAAKYMFTNVDTNTEYLNSFESQAYTFGLGYRGEVFYFDAAYKLTKRDSEFYPFYDSYDENGVTLSNRGAKVTENKNQMVITVGMRF